MGTPAAVQSGRLDRVHQAGVIGVVAGLVGAASGIFLTLYPPDVPDDRYSYPLTATGFTLIQSFFFLQHLGLVVILAALWKSGAGGRSRLGRTGVVGSVVAMLGLSVVELVAISARDSLYPGGRRTELLDALYGVTTLAIGAFMVVAGIAVITARRWTGWYRWLPVGVGIYVFVVLTPGIMAGYTAARLVITGWMLGFALLGWALVRDRGTT